MRFKPSTGSDSREACTLRRKVGIMVAATVPPSDTTTASSSGVSARMPDEPLRRRLRKSNDDGGGLACFDRDALGLSTVIGVHEHHRVRTGRNADSHLRCL